MLLVLVAGLALAAKPSKIKDPDTWAADLWAANCRHCHGPRGLGDGALTGALGAPALAGVVRDDDATVALVQDGRGTMPGFRELLNRGDTIRVLDWMGRLDPETGLLPGEKPKQPAEGPATPRPPEAPPRPPTVPVGDPAAAPGGSEEG